jgi:dihydrofolate reductase
MSDFFKRIDAVFMGRKSYELALGMGGDASGMPKMEEYVFSNTLQSVEGDRILVKGDIAKEINKIKNRPGKDIWLFGGAALTASLMNLGLIDEFWLSVHPVVLGSGKPLFQNISERKKSETARCENLFHRPCFT